MDADDMSKPNRIRLQHEYLLANPEVGLIGGNISLFGDLVKKRVHVYSLSNTFISESLAFENCVAHPTVMFRKNIFDKLGGYRSKYPHAEDWDLWLRFQKVSKIFNLDEVLLDYRIHDSSISRVYTKVQNCSINSLIIDNLKDLGFVGIDDLSLMRTVCTDLNIARIYHVLLSILNQNKRLKVFSTEKLAEIFHGMYIQFLLTTQSNFIYCLQFFYSNPIPMNKISLIRLPKIFAMLLVMRIKRSFN
jgi:hypothetical protein